MPEYNNRILQNEREVNEPFSQIEEKIDENITKEDDVVIYYGGIVNVGGLNSEPIFQSIFFDKKSNAFEKHKPNIVTAINQKIRDGYELQYYPSIKVKGITKKFYVEQEKLGNNSTKVFALVLVATLEMEHKLDINLNNQDFNKYEFFTGVSALLVEHGTGEVKVAANALGNVTYTGKELSPEEKINYFAISYENTAIDALEKLRHVRRNSIGIDDDDAQMITKVIVNSADVRSLFSFPQGNEQCRVNTCFQLRALIAQGVANAYSSAGYNMLPPLNVTSWGRHLEGRSGGKIINSQYGTMDYGNSTETMNKGLMKIILKPGEATKHLHVKITGTKEKAVSTGKYFYVWGFKTWLKVDWCESIGNSMREDIDWCDVESMKGSIQVIASKRPIISHKVTNTEPFDNEKRRSYYIASILKSLKEFDNYAK